MANDLISCFKLNCSNEDIQNNGAYFEPKILGCFFIKTLDENDKIVYDDECDPITCRIKS